MKEQRFAKFHFAINSHPDLSRFSGNLRRDDTKRASEVYGLNILLTLTRRHSPSHKARVYHSLNGVVPAPFVRELFLFFSDRARERSSSANGNGDRTLETISIKIFDRCDASRKLATTATKKENGGSGGGGVGDGDSERVKNAARG